MIRARLGNQGFRKNSGSPALCARLPDTSAVALELRRVGACRLLDPHCYTLDLRVREPRSITDMEVLMCPRQGQQTLLAEREWRRGPSTAALSFWRFASELESRVVRAFFRQQ